MKKATTVAAPITLFDASGLQCPLGSCGLSGTRSRACLVKVTPPPHTQHTQTHTHTHLCFCVGTERYPRNPSVLSFGVVSSKYLLAIYNILAFIFSPHPPPPPLPLFPCFYTFYLYILLFFSIYFFPLHLYFQHIQMPKKRAKPCTKPKKKQQKKTTATPQCKRKNEALTKNTTETRECPCPSPDPSHTPCMNFRVVVAFLLLPVATQASHTPERPLHVHRMCS